MAPFSERLQNALSRAKLSRAQLAERLDIAPSTITRWFTDGAMPQRRIQRHLCALLGVGPKWLFEGEGSPEPSVGLYVGREGEDPEVLNISEPESSRARNDEGRHRHDMLQAFLANEETTELYAKLHKYINSKDPQLLRLAQLVLQEITSRGG